MVMADNRQAYRQSFVSKLEQLGINYQFNNKAILCFEWKTGKSYRFPCEMIFVDNRLSFKVKVISLLTETIFPDAYYYCGVLNNKINWLKVFIDKHRAVFCMVETELNADDVIDECTELLRRMENAVVLIQDVFQELLKLSRGENNE